MHACRRSDASVVPTSEKKPFSSAVAAKSSAFDVGAGAGAGANNAGFRGGEATRDGARARAARSSGTRALVGGNFTMVD